MKHKPAIALLAVVLLAVASEARRRGSQPIPATPQNLKDLKC